jgi:cytochrome c-type biogenesis protein CcmH
LLLWIVIALLTAAAILAVLVPLARAPQRGTSAAYAGRVYRDQLDELERDKAEGRINAGEAETARAEIARRLIAVDNEARAEREDAGVATAGVASATSLPPAPRRAVALVALLGIPILSLGLYLGLGAPWQPGEPLAARLSAPIAANDVERLVAKVEEHLAQNPEDGRGWEVIAPVYLRLGRAADAVQAYRTAIRLLGATAQRQSDLGEAIFTSEGGIVTAVARNAFEAAHVSEPTAPAPRFYLAIAAEQDGKPEQAAAMFRSLLADAPADATWRGAVETALARLQREGAQAGRAAPGPTASEVAAAEDMAPADRSAMIDSMVTQLAARLKDNPDDVEGWLRLIRSYSVLGRTEDAANAGRAALAGVRDDGSRQRVQELLASLRVTPAGEATP